MEVLPMVLNNSDGVNGSDIGNSTNLEAILEAEKERVLPEIVAYSILFVVGATGNLKALADLLKRRHLRKAINLLMAHLTFADLLVVFITIPIEIIWRFTISWKGGLLGCKLFQALRVFGLYLSSLLIVCVSVDRYFVFTQPSRNTITLTKSLIQIAWCISFLLSLPQAEMYRLQHHPEYEGYIQCVNFNYFEDEWKHRAYNVLCLIGMYFGPLVAICICYTKILRAVYSRNYTKRVDAASGSISFKESSVDERNEELKKNLTQAAFFSYIHQRNWILKKTKRRALNMSLIIVFAFIVCWSPYVFMVLWYQLDEESVEYLHPWIQQGLFIFAVANSCVNPFVYRINLVRKFSPSLTVV